MRALLAMETRNVRTPISVGSKSRFFGLTLVFALAALSSQAYVQAAKGTTDEEEEEGKAAPATKGAKATPTPTPAAIPAGMATPAAGAFTVTASEWSVLRAKS